MIYLFGYNSIALAIAAELESQYLEYRIVADFVPNNGFAFGNANSIQDKFLLSSAVQYVADDIVLNCVGYKHLADRASISDRFSGAGLLNSYISKYAVIENTVKIGLGSIVLAGAVLERGVEIGNGCIVWGGARLCHDVRVGSYCFLASGSIVGGFAMLPSFSSIGFNTVIEDHYKSENGSPIKPGALAFVKKDGTVYR